MATMHPVGPAVEQLHFCKQSEQPSLASSEQAAGSTPQNLLNYQQSSDMETVQSTHPHFMINFMHSVLGASSGNLGNNGSNLNLTL